MISNIQLIPMNDAKFGIKNKALVCNLWLKDVCCHLKKMLLLFWRLFVFDLFFLIAMCHSDNSVILQQEKRGKEMQIDDIMRSEEVMR